MSNFDFSVLDLKKTLHSSLRRPLAPFSAGLPLWSGDGDMTFSK
jgi:hypothetical protein